MSPDKLVRMVNQIALFFAAQGADAAPEAVAAHLRQFWDPRMRRAILAHAEVGGAGLSPIAAAAVARLAVDEPA